jgi:hypothetical protein
MISLVSAADGCQDALVFRVMSLVMATRSYCSRIALQHFEQSVMVLTRPDHHADPQRSFCAVSDAQREEACGRDRNSREYWVSCWDDKMPAWAKKPGRRPRLRGWAYTAGGISMAEPRQDALQGHRFEGGLTMFSQPTEGGPADSRSIAMSSATPGANAA